MRFEVTAAYVIGALLPLLETMRRGLAHWLVDFTTMFEDYLAGGLLLAAATLASRGWRHAPAFLVLAWAYCTGMMGSSFWGQVEASLRGHEVEVHNGVVIAFKLLLWGTCVVSLLLSFRRLARGAA